MVQPRHDPVTNPCPKQAPDEPNLSQIRFAAQKSGLTRGGRPRNDPEDAPLERSGRLEKAFYLFICLPFSARSS